MELLNATPMPAGYTMGLKPDGQELLVVVVKGTFILPLGGQQPKLAEEQAPLVEADIFSGEPGFSAPVYEVDYAPYKPRCDVMLHGNAYAPNDAFVKRLTVSLQVGSWRKSFSVVGDREWVYSALIGIGPNAPQPFQVMPITYERAFGGTDDRHPESNKHDAYLPNPIGRGYHYLLSREYVDNAPLPNTEALNQAIRKPNGRYQPMAFGPIGRNWAPRYQLAGTYDQHWLDHVFPFLPADFQDAYYQCAPEDQQMDYLKGGETVKLIHLTPQGETQFQLPTVDVPVTFFLKHGDSQQVQAVADTLILEPEAERLMITWRTHLPLKKNMFEVPQVLVGKKSRGWWRARQLGKTYYPSLAALDKAREESE